MRIRTAALFALIALLVSGCGAKKAPDHQILGIDLDHAPNLPLCADPFSDAVSKTCMVTDEVYRKSSADAKAFSGKHRIQGIKFAVDELPVFLANNEIETFPDEDSLIPHTVLLPIKRERVGEVVKMLKNKYGEPLEGDVKNPEQLTWAFSDLVVIFGFDTNDPSDDSAALSVMSRKFSPAYIDKLKAEVASSTRRKL